MTVQSSKEVTLKGFSQYTAVRDGVNFDDEKVTGVFFARASHTNSPKASYWWYVEVYSITRGDGRYVLQRATQDTGAACYQRTCSEGAWTAWRQVY